MSEGIIKKKSIFTTIKIIIAVLLAFTIIVVGTVGVLYLTNKKAKNIINTQVKKYKAHKELQEKSQEKGNSDPRVPRLAKHYLQMSTAEAADTLNTMKKTDKKAYKKILSSMMIQNAAKTEEIKQRIEVINSKRDVIKEEYEAMLAEKMDESKTKSSYYSSLGIKGSIDAIENELKNRMEYDSVAEALGNMQPQEVAKILHYINPIYTQGIKNRLGNDFLRSVENEEQKYEEFIRKNASLGHLYGKSESEIAAKKLEDEKTFSDDALAVIFANMDYMEAARILNAFEDTSRVQDILSKIKEIEDYQMSFEGSYSSVVANTIKVLKNYEKDVDILKAAYGKMEAQDLAEVVDKLLTTTPAYKTYRIDAQRSFNISEKNMTIDTLKKMKPDLVGQVIAELKNTNKVDKAAYLSREIGIPEPSR